MLQVAVGTSQSFALLWCRVESMCEILDGGGLEWSGR